MGKATITVRDLPNGRLAVKINLDPHALPESGAHEVAACFLSWLASQQNPQNQPAAPQQQP